MQLNLTDEESEALLRELNAIIENDRFPLSPRIRMLRQIRAKLPGAPPSPPPARPDTRGTRPRASTASGKATPQVKSEPGPPMTLGNAAATRVRLIVWCKACGHQVEPDPDEHARRYGAPDDRARLAKAARMFGLRQPRHRYGGHRNRATASRRAMRRLGNVIAGIVLALVNCSAIADDRGRLVPKERANPRRYSRDACRRSLRARICKDSPRVARQGWHTCEIRDRPRSRFSIRGRRSDPGLSLGGNDASPLNHRPQLTAVTVKH
jgi:hypothetical protein